MDGCYDWHKDNGIYLQLTTNDHSLINICNLASRHDICLRARSGSIQTSLVLNTSHVLDSSRAFWSFVFISICFVSGSCYIYVLFCIYLSILVFV